MNAFYDLKSLAVAVRTLLDDGEESETLTHARQLLAILIKKAEQGAQATDATTLVGSRS